MHRYDLAKTLIISVEMLIRYRVIGRDCYNYELLMALDRILRYTVSLMTSAEKGQPPPNDPKELRDDHSVAFYFTGQSLSYILLFASSCTFHVSLYTLILNVALFTFHFTLSPLHIPIYTFHFIGCTLHVGLHIALYSLHFTHCTFTH